MCNETGIKTNFERASLGDGVYPHQQCQDTGRHLKNTENKLHPHDIFCH